MNIKGLDLGDIIAIAPLILLLLWATARLFVAYTDYGQTFNFVMAIVALIIISMSFLIFASAKGELIKREEEREKQ